MTAIEAVDPPALANNMKLVLGCARVSGCVFVEMGVVRFGRDSRPGAMNAVARRVCSLSPDAGYEPVSLRYYYVTTTACVLLATGHAKTDRDRVRERWTASLQVCAYSRTCTWRTRRHPTSAGRSHGPAPVTLIGGQLHSAKLPGPASVVRSRMFRGRLCGARPF